MKRPWFAISALTFALAATTGLVTLHAHAATPAAAGFTQDRPWDQPPDEYRDVQKQGFRDGVEAARHDWDEHHHRDADDHERYKHPPVERSLRDDFRDGFRHGYETAWHHMEEHHDHD
jgi:hypothetical protein